MATTLFALPIKPGQSEAARAFAKECFEHRYAEFDASERRCGIRAENWYLHHTPSGDLLTLQIEGDDLNAGFATFMGSRDPFDLWCKQQMADLTGVDVNAGPPPAEMIAETLGEYNMAARPTATPV